MIGHFSNPWVQRSMLVLAPIALVRLGGLLLGAEGPDTAAATQDTGEEASATAAPAPDLAIEAWEQQSLDGPAFKSPMVEAAPESQPTELPKITSATTQAPGTQQPGTQNPGLVLSGVSAGKGSPSAAIVNGRLRRVGEAVAPGYRLVSVDAPGRSARVSGPDGTVLVLVIHR